MISQRDLSELGDTLAAGFTLDRLVRTLAKIERTHEIPTNVEGELKAATTTLDAIRTGERLRDEARFPAGAGDFALAFDRAAQASQVFNITSSGDFNQLIEDLRVTADSLIQHQLPADERLQKLRRFFALIAKLALQESQAAVIRGEMPVPMG